MLIIGRLGVALMGGAVVCLSAWALVTYLMNPPSGSSFLLFALALPVTLAGTVAAARGRAWGATLIAAIYGAVGLVLLWFGAWWAILLLGASVLALAVAVALRRAQATAGAA